MQNASPSMDLVTPDEAPEYPRITLLALVKKWLPGCVVCKPAAYVSSARVLA